MIFLNVFISFFVILIILFFAPFYFLAINSSNTLSFKVRKIALLFKMGKKEFYLLIKIFIYSIVSLIYLLLIYLSSNFKTLNYQYFVFKTQDLLFLSFFVLAPLVSVGIFIFFRIFDKKNKFYLTILNKKPIALNKSTVTKYLLEVFDHYLAFVFWALIMPILINIYNPAFNFYVAVFLCNVLLIISLVIFNFIKFDQTNYRFFQPNDSLTKIRIVNFLIWINVFLVNMLLSNFQYNIVLILLISIWTKLFSKYLFIFQYAYFFSEKIF